LLVVSGFGHIKPQSSPDQWQVCTDDGTVYDVTNVVPYVMKYKKHPVTGQPLALRDLVRLSWHKNTGDCFCCVAFPVLFLALLCVVSGGFGGDSGRIRFVKEANHV
jgi:hypothetical protein